MSILSDSEKAAMLDKLQKLKSMANCPGASQGEIENALRLMGDLLHKYNLNDADVSAHAGEKQDAEERARTMFKIDVAGWQADHGAWEGSLCTFVAKLCGCFIYLNRGHGGVIRDVVIGDQVRKMECGKFTFFGERERVELARILYERLSASIYGLALGFHGGANKKDGREFALGFVSGLSERRRQDDNARDANEIRRVGAMVLVSKQIAYSWLNSAHGVKLSNGRRAGCNTKSAAFAAGHERGRQTAVNAARDPALSGRRALPGR